MKLHLTAVETKDDAGNVHRVLDGRCRFETLARNGVQMISTQHLVERFAPFTTVEGDTITFDSHDGDIVFDIIEKPGVYCLTCGERLGDMVPDAAAAKAAQDHVKAHGKSAEKTERWPHGYRSHPKSYLCKVQETETTKRLMAAGG